MKITDLELFYRYALPCGELGVELGLLDPEKVNSARESFLDGHLFGEPEKAFPVAVRLLELTAGRLGRGVIDREVIRRYFWDFHDEHVREKALLVEDFPVDECMVWPGEMVSQDVARTPVGEKKVKKLLVPNVKRGDFVSVHNGYVCERLMREEFEHFSRCKRDGFQK